MEPSSLPLRPSMSRMPVRQREQQQNYGDYSLPSHNSAQMDMTGTGQHQGLGTYGYSVLNPVGNGSPIPPYSQSMTTPNLSSIPVDLITYSSQSTPNIISAEYDPFPSYSQELTPYGSALHQVRSTATSLPPPSPSPSGAASHRSSFSSAPASECYSNPDQYSTFHPRTMIEGGLEWPSEVRSGVAMTTTGTSSLVGTSSASSFPGLLGDTVFESGSMNWASSQSQSHDAIPTRPSSTLERHSSGESLRAHARSQRLSGSATRTRTPRRMTTREDANYQCQEKGCGKLFSRSYNYKAHMETHDAGRLYPFPCPLPDCGKRFVRKTDLQRHHQSVHMKERNHQCDFCCRFFARKDTLRRHMEDGCSKRFDITFKLNQPAETTQMESSACIPSPAQFPFTATSLPYSGPETRPAEFYGNYAVRPDFKDGEKDQVRPW